MHELLQACQRLAPFVIGLLAVAWVVRVRKLSWREHFAVRGLSPWALAGWLSAWIVWVAASEWLQRRLGFPPPKPHHAGAVVAGLFLLGMVVLAPLLEELIFRGVLFWRIEKSLGAIAAVGLTAVVFAALHFQDDAKAMVFIGCDALLFALARKSTGSLLASLAMHSTGNLLAWSQRFGGL